MNSFSKDSERATFVRLFERCKTYIWHLRDDRSRMTIYEHLEWLHRRWDASPPGAIQRLVERLRGRHSTAGSIASAEATRSPCRRPFSQFPSPCIRKRP